MKNNNLIVPKIHKFEIFSNSKEVDVKYTLVCGATAIEDVGLTDLQNIQKVLNEFLEKEK